MDVEFVIRQSVSVSAALMTLTGTELLVRRKRSGFAIKFLAQIPWIALAVMTQAWGILILAAAILFVSARGYWRWR